jgi:hypothetical protein
LGAHCSCPYDWGGDCTHIVAVLLRMQNRAEILIRPALGDLFGDLPREALVELLLDLAARHPELVDELDLLAWVVARFGPVELAAMAPHPKPFALFGAPEMQIPVNAIEQLETVMRLPIAEAGALMPDAHLGYAMPIGGVVSLDHAISPSFVGYDMPIWS